MKTDYYSFLLRLTQAEKEKALEIANKLGMSFNSLFRYLLNTYANKQKRRK